MGAGDMMLFLERCGVIGLEGCCMFLSGMSFVSDSSGHKQPPPSTHTPMCCHAPPCALAGCWHASLNRSYWLWGCRWAMVMQKGT